MFPTRAIPGKCNSVTRIVEVKILCGDPYGSTAIGLYLRESDAESSVRAREFVCEENKGQIECGERFVNPDRTFIDPIHGGLALAVAQSPFRFDFVVTPTPGDDAAENALAKPAPLVHRRPPPPSFCPDSPSSTTLSNASRIAIAKLYGDGIDDLTLTRVPLNDLPQKSRLCEATVGLSGDRMASVAVFFAFADKNDQLMWRQWDAPHITGIIDAASVRIEARDLDRDGEAELLIWESLLNGPEGEAADELWERLRGPNEVHLNVLSWTPKAIITRWSWLVTSEPSTRKPGAFERNFDVEFLSDRTRCITLTGHDAVGTYVREPIRGTYDCSNWTRRE